MKLYTMKMTKIAAFGVAALLMAGCGTDLEGRGGHLGKGGGNDHQLKKEVIHMEIGKEYTINRGDKITKTQEGTVVKVNASTAGSGTTATLTEGGADLIRG